MNVDSRLKTFGNYLEIKNCFGKTNNQHLRKACWNEYCDEHLFAHVDEGFATRRTDDGNRYAKCLNKKSGIFACNSLGKDCKCI